MVHVLEDMRESKCPVPDVAMPPKHPNRDFPPSRRVVTGSAASGNRRQLLLCREHPGEEVADLEQARTGVADGPAVAAQVGIVPSSSHVIGIDTGAPGAGTHEYGATSVLLIAFCV